MKKAHQIFLISLLTIASIIGLNKLASVSCPQIDVFRGDSLYLNLKFYGFIVLGVAVWTIGYLFSKRLNLKKKQQVCYFILLSLLSTSNSLNQIWENNFSESSELIKSICEKSRDDGTVYEADNLTANEYHYLLSSDSWLPKAPAIATGIKISYYRDEFLGDYALNIEMEIPEDEKLDPSKYPK